MAFCCSNWNRLRWSCSLGLCYPGQALDIHVCLVLSYWIARRQNFPALMGNSAGQRRPGQTALMMVVVRTVVRTQLASHWVCRARRAQDICCLTPASQTRLPNLDASTLIFIPSVWGFRPLGHADMLTLVLQIQGQTTHPSHCCW